ALWPRRAQGLRYQGSRRAPLSAHCGCADRRPPLGHPAGVLRPLSAAAEDRLGRALGDTPPADRTAEGGASRYFAAGTDLCMRWFIVSAMYTFPCASVAMPIGRLNSPGPLPVFPHADLRVPSLYRAQR